MYYGPRNKQRFCDELHMVILTLFIGGLYYVLHFAMGSLLLLFCRRSQAIGTLSRVSFVSSWRGHTLAMRDIEPQSPRTDIVLYSKEPLPVYGIQDQDTSLYVYQDLKLIDANKDYLFVLGSSSPISATSSVTTPVVFALPRNDDLILKLGR